MARAETIETVGENGPLCHNTCCMELPPPLHTYSGSFITRAPRGGSRVTAPNLQSSPHHVEQTLSVSNPPSHPHQAGQDEAQTHQQSPALSPSSEPSCCLVRDESSRRTVSSDNLSGQQTDSNREERQNSSPSGPLPDLLPQNEISSRASPPHQRRPGGAAVQQLDVLRVASQLRVIGDEFNARIVHRAHVAPQWQDWRDIYRGLFNFMAQMFSALYRLT
ncbi:PREDICTED: uncharacterized protein LOC107100754 [Cyprinodon variegatus]|uniref:uncharacterized protein LOC107100754 n=1 Tax=Cyprinodon variegatus TaxID=28743 RepID=UPI000742C03B|nr:PREDICTED: uncharacterized protein LOC107100754 [Cyprinodon variegatus]